MTDDAYERRSGPDTSDVYGPEDPARSREVREGAAGFEPGGVGAWSPRGEFLGVVSRTEDRRTLGDEPLDSDYLHVERGGGESGTSATLHRFSRGGEEGYRVKVRRWDEAGEDSYWIAPTVEDAGYIGLFTEDEARRAFPYLFAALEMPDGFGIL